MSPHHSVEATPTASDPGPLSAATHRLRAQLGDFITRHVAPHPTIKAVVVYGSVASGAATESSDVDAFVFMDPVDPWLLPAEAIWNPEEDSFRSIFSERPVVPGELQLDLTRVSLQERRGDAPWPPADRAALTHRWVAFERPGTDVESLVVERIAMSERERRTALDAALLAADGLLENPETLWERDELEALDALNAMWEAVMAGTYAINRVWMPYRGRGVRGLRRLPWRGALGDDLLMRCVATDGTDRAAFVKRAAALTRAHEALLAHLQDDPEFGEDPTFAAFLRAHDEPGRAWNIEEWSARHRGRRHR